MQVIVVFEDMKVSIDGEVKLVQSMPTYDPNWRVIQWKEDKGWIEVHKGDRVWLTDISTVQPFIDAYVNTIVEIPVIDTAPAD